MLAPKTPEAAQLEPRSAAILWSPNTTLQFSDTIQLRILYLLCAAFEAAKECKLFEE